MKQDTVNGKKVICYDYGFNKKNGRYTVYYLNYFYPVSGRKVYECRCMDSQPSHPLGFSLFAHGERGRHNGKRIPFTALPIDCQKAVINDLSGEKPC